MTRRLAHSRSDLLRYIDGEVDDGERQVIDAHLKSCNSCREYVSFVRGLTQDLSDLREEEFTTDEPHVDSWTLVSHEEGKLDEETARHVRGHLLYCDTCQEDFLALRQARRAASWAERLSKLGEAVVDLGKRYGIGTLLGSAKIVGEQLALATRGEGRPEAVSKVFEIAVGENNYSIEISVAPNRSVSCNVAGFKTPQWTSLRVAVCSETGEEFFATETDERGNTQFTLTREEVPRDICVLVFALGNTESYVPFRVPEETVRA